MQGSIRAERIDPRTSLGAEESFVGKVLLPGEVAGVTIRHCIARRGRLISLEEELGKVHVRVFLHGSGNLAIGSCGYAIDGIGVAALTRDPPAVVESTSDRLEFLDIALDVDAADEDELSKHAAQLPYFRLYSDCPVYREEIKSAKTVSRTLVPPDLLPRFSMGSVQTTGPDIVHAHQHAMLEQFFFGLQGNSCRVQADGQGISFGDNVLVHIPLGSLHSVSVEHAHVLHYLWLDYFRHQEDMSYISQAHIPVKQ
jgi:hypothetical protein